MKKVIILLILPLILIAILIWMGMNRINSTVTSLILHDDPYTAHFVQVGILYLSIGILSLYGIIFILLGMLYFKKNKK